MILNQPDINQMPFDTPVRFKDSMYVKTFVKNAEETVKVRHGLGKRPWAIALEWSSVPVIFQEDTNADGSTRSTATDAFLTFFESKTTVLLRFQ